MKKFASALLIAANVIVGTNQLVAAQTIPQFNTAAAEMQCSEKWTKRGVLDANMYNYCMERQSEGYLKANEYVAKYSQVPFLKEIIAAAEDTWLKPHDYQYEMLAYVIEKEGEAFLDVTYDVETGKYSQEQFAVCSDKWFQRSDSPKWSMVRFCLKND